MKSLTEGALTGRRFLCGSVALFLGLLIAAGPLRGATEGESWSGRLGDPAPALTLEDLEGRSVSLASLRGRVVLVNLWATYCIPCRHEMPLLDRIAEARSADGLTILGVSVDAPEAEERVRELARELDLSYPVLLDPRGRATDLFPAPALPASFLFDREGRLVWKRLGVIAEEDPELEESLEAALEDARREARALLRSDR